MFKIFRSPPPPFHTDQDFEVYPLHLQQEAHGPSRSHEKVFVSFYFKMIKYETLKSIAFQYFRYMYIKQYINRLLYWTSHLKIYLKGDTIFTIQNFHDIYVNFGVNIGVSHAVVFERKILKRHKSFVHILIIISIFRKFLSLIFIILRFPSHQDALFIVWLNFQVLKKVGI